MQSFTNTVTIERPIEDVFAFLADFENVPTWNRAIEATTRDVPWTGRGGNRVPPDPFYPKQERRGLRGDRFRAREPTRD